MTRATRGASAVVTVRVPVDLSRRLTRLARSGRRTRSETARMILTAALAGSPADDPAVEARRQSRLASGRASERDALAFVATAADLRGWR